MAAMFESFSPPLSHLPFAEHHKVTAPRPGPPLGCSPGSPLHRGFMSTWVGSAHWQRHCTTSETESSALVSATCKHVGHSSAHTCFAPQRSQCHVFTEHSIQIGPRTSHTFVRQGSTSVGEEHW